MKEKIFYSTIDMAYDSDDGKETIILITDWFMPIIEIVAGDYLEIINSNNESIEVKINSIKTKPNGCEVGGHNKNNVFIHIDKNDSPLLKIDNDINEYNEIYLLKQETNE